MSTDAHDPARELYLQWLHARKLRGQWEVKSLTAEPSERPFEPWLWKRDELRTAARDALGVIAPGGSHERRTIALVGSGKPDVWGATRTIQASFHSLAPGEEAEFHKHSLAAIRFFILGHRCSTTVEGERITMEPGDLVLTPPGIWHGHVNEGAEAAFWMDALDVPLVRYLNAIFFDAGDPAQRPPLRASWEPGTEGTCAYVHRWRDVEQQLRARAAEPGCRFNGVLHRYLSPSGGPLFPTFTCLMRMLRPGERTAVHRHTASSICYVHRGEGAITAGAAEFAWEEGDCFTIPPWTWHHYENQSPHEPAFVFSVTDSPIFEALGLYRMQAAEG